MEVLVQGREIFHPSRFVLLFPSSVLVFQRTTYPCTDLPSEFTGKIWAKALLQRHRAINEISLIYVFVDAFSQFTFCSFQNRMHLSHPLFLQLHFLPHEDTEFTDLNLSRTFLKFIFTFSILQSTGIRAYFRPTYTCSASPIPPRGF